MFRSEKFYIGRRLHHKICVFDGVQALTGGINIADRYRGTEGELPWLDYAVYVAGAAAGQLRQVCLRYWNKATDMKLGGLQPGGPVQTELAGRSLQHGSARVRINDRVKGKNEIWKTYFDILNQAKESITIICSYFIPGWIFLRLIRKAISRGVTVRVILAGISDVMLAKHAERYLYRWMLRHGVEIYEYKHSVLHAKVAIRDSRQMTIGSYNLNNISALASIECNLEVRNKPFVSQVEKELLAIALHDSERITPANFKATQNLVKQFWQWTCYQIIKVVLFLATFYFRREH